MMIKGRREYKFYIEGHPMGKGRHRDGKGKAKFTPEETTIYQQKIQMAFRQHHAGRLVTSGVEYHIGLKIFYSGHTADIDNILKIVMDALTGFIWSDDNITQVVGVDYIHTIKVSDGAECIAVKVREV